MPDSSLAIPGLPIATGPDRLQVVERPFAWPVEVAPAWDGLLATLGGPSTGEPIAPTFLDLETTGLHAGTGTLVIVVGLAFRTATGGVVRQYLLHDPAAEPALLAAVAADLGPRPVLVTFNGKSFDLPMLVGRFLLHRLADPTPARHLDLLPPARRVWGRRLRPTSLGMLEARVLGISRERDVWGGDIPQRYFAYLHDRDAAAMEPVLDHNRQDLISLVYLAAHLDRLLREPPEPGALWPGEHLGLAALAEASGQTERARRHYQTALAGAPPAERAEALFHLAELGDREHQLDAVIALYDAVTRFSTGPVVPAALRLAKIYEHQRRDPGQALVYARRAYQQLIRGSPASPRALAELARRIARLEQKLEGRRGAGRSATGPSAPYPVNIKGVPGENQLVCTGHPPNKRSGLARTG